MAEDTQSVVATVETSDRTVETKNDEESAESKSVSKNETTDAEDLNNKKQRKKRKTFSCDVCRKFKTRCDFHPSAGICHRCNVLKLECSLATGKTDKTDKNTETGQNQLGITDSELNDKLTPTKGMKFSRDSASPELISINSSKLRRNLNEENSGSLEVRFSNLENKISFLDKKIDKILSVLKTTDSSNSPEPLPNRAQPISSIFQSASQTNSLRAQNSDKILMDKFVIKDPPLNLISAIDEDLFPIKALSKNDEIAQQQRPFIVARINFLQFYEMNRQLCHKLVKEFLIRSHFWIIPGGIKEIDEKYAHEHSFITSVFIIIGMSFDDNEKCTNKQTILYPLVETLLTNTLTMFDELTDFDIEAILYCCMFHISRKTKRHRQLKFNSMLLSNFAISSLLNIVDFRGIENRVIDKQEYNAEDLYHLRILNSLTACNLEYSISSGNATVQNPVIIAYNNLTTKFPQANFGDNIKVSEIYLNLTLNNIFLSFKPYMSKIYKMFEESCNTSEATKKLIKFYELHDWLDDWKELLNKDGAGVLLFTFDFYHIMLCRSLIIESLIFIEKDSLFVQSLLYTMKEHAFSLLKGFLRLPPALFKGAPIFTTHQLVYACLTLCDYSYYYGKTERQQILNVCTKVYWHLNTIGEKMNEATINVGKIIKNIIDNSKSKNKSKSNKLRSSKPSVMNPIDPNLAPSDIQKSQTFETNFPTKKLIASRMVEKDSTEFVIPDVDKFNSFEDFFQTFFEQMKPNTHSLFNNSHED